MTTYILSAYLWKLDKICLICLQAQKISKIGHNRNNEGPKDF